MACTRMPREFAKYAMQHARAARMAAQVSAEDAMKDGC